MRNKSGDKYGALIFKKNSKAEIGCLFEKGDIIYGNFRGFITLENNIVLCRDLNGNIYYTGVNRVDCIYKRFSTRAFVRVKHFELYESRNARFGEVGQSKERQKTTKRIKFLGRIKNRLDLVAEYFLGIFVDIA
jgi:hypothetical protein